MSHTSNRPHLPAWCVACVAAGLLAGPAAAATNEVRLLSLRDCIDQAMLQNLQLRVRRYDPGIASQDVETAAAAFDVNLDADARYSESRAAAAASELEGSDQPMTDRKAGRAGLEKRFAPGTVVSIEAALNEVATDSSFSTLNPAVDASVNLAVRQPLLKDSGILVNRAAVRRAEISVVQADERLRAAALDLARDIEFAYWSLALALERREVSRMAVTLSEQLLAEASARFEKGINTEADVMQAEADLASKQESVLVSRQAIDDARDQLLTLLNTLHEEGDVPVETEPIPDALPERPEVDSAYRAALQHQPEYRILREERRVRVLDRDVARRQHRPALDLEALAGTSGLGESRSDAYAGLRRGDGYAWQVNLLLHLPWGLRREEADLRRSTYRLIQTDLTIEQAQVEMLRDVRMQCRAVWTGIERVGVTRRARDMHELYLEQERARFRAGLITVRNVMDAQDDLNEARLRVLVAIRATIDAAVQLARLEGTLLDAHGIEWNVDQASLSYLGE